MKFKCQQCGNCCRQLSIYIGYDDIMRWVEQDRQDILKETVFCKGAPSGDGFYFEHTVTAPKQACKFLKDNRCTIYETRPMVCKDFPHSMSKITCCPIWKKEYFNKSRYKKILGRQDKSFKKCVTNFDQLLNITMKARGFGHLKTEIGNKWHSHR